NNNTIPDIVLGTSGRRIMAVEGIPNPDLDVGPIRPFQKDNDVVKTITELLYSIQTQTGGLSFVFLLTTVLIVASRFRKRRVSEISSSGGSLE
ncbi:MAG: hypothetical protein ACFFB3_14990, partial [Candidatus Hodarchaeota archaeon]